MALPSGGQVVAVCSESALHIAVQNASPGQIIQLCSKTWTDLDLVFQVNGTTSAPIVLRAETAGKVILDNPSIQMAGDRAVLDGLVIDPGDRRSIILRRQDKSAVCRHCRLTKLTYDASTINL